MASQGAEGPRSSQQLGGSGLWGEHSHSLGLQKELIEKIDTTSVYLPPVIKLLHFNGITLVFQGSNQEMQGRESTEKLQEKQSWRQSQQKTDGGTERGAGWRARQRSTGQAERGSTGRSKEGKERGCRAREQRRGGRKKARLYWESN